jgi:hypothetical protein
MSAKRTETSSLRSAITPCETLSRSTIGRGKMLRRSLSDRSCSSLRSRCARSREWTKYSRIPNVVTDGPMMLRAKKTRTSHDGISSAGSQAAVDRGRERHEPEEDSEPADRRPRPVEDERAERSDERPERDRARLNKPAQAPLEEEGQDEDQRDLAGAVHVVALRPGEEGKAGHAQDLVRDRDEGREPEAERSVRPDPDEGERGDQERREHERRVPEPLLGSVRGHGARIGGPRHHRLRPLANAHTETLRSGAVFPGTTMTHLDGIRVSTTRRWKDRR